MSLRKKNGGKNRRFFYSVSNTSDVKAEMHDVTVLNDVVLAFQTPFTGFFGAVFTLVLNKIVIADDFGADKTTFKVGVNSGGGARCGITHFNGPGAHFFYAGGKVSLQAQQLVTGADNPVQAGFFHAHFLQEFQFVFVVQLGNFRFDFIANGYDGSAFGSGNRRYGIQVRVVLKTV